MLGDAAKERPLANRVLWGVGEMLWAAIGSAVVATMVYGSAAPEPAGSSRVALWQLMVIYFGGGILSGVIIGVLQPITKRLPGLLITSIAGAFPFAVAIMTMGPDGSISPLNSSWLLGVVVLACLGGCLVTGILKAREGENDVLK